MNKLKFRYHGLGGKKKKDYSDHDDSIMSSSSPSSTSSSSLVLPTIAVNANTNNNSNSHHLQRNFSPNKSFLSSIQQQRFRLRSTMRSRRQSRGFMNNKSKWKCTCRTIVYLAFKLLLAFILYAYCMSLYNTRSIRDPCVVAENARQSLSINTNTNSNSNSNSNLLPKIIHQQWKDDQIPQKFLKWRNKWFHLYPEPEYTHMLWTDDNGRSLIEEHYPWFIETYDNYNHNINRADAVRYFVLHHYGGIYADLDYEPLTNFYNYLPQDKVGVIESPYYWNEKTQNCLMTSPKGHVFWEDYLFHQLVLNAAAEEVLEATGPQLLDSAVELSRRSQSTSTSTATSTSHEDDHDCVHVLPCENFQRVPLGEYSETLFTTVIDREMMFRLKPISKHCGLYRDLKCQFGRHHNTVSYRTTSGRVL